MVQVWMYLEEGIKLIVIFLWLRKPCKKGAKWLIFPLSPMPKLIKISRIHKNVRGADIWMKFSVYTPYEVCIEMA